MLRNPLATGGKTRQELLTGVALLSFIAAFLFAGVHESLAQDDRFYPTANRPKHFPVLAACVQRQYEIFKKIDFEKLTVEEEIREANEFTKWSEKYHETVGKIIEENLGEFTDVDHSPMRRSMPPPRCTADTYAQFFPPRPELKAIARKLPSWENKHGINNNIDRLTQADIGTVLLEYLRMYECALIELSLLLPVETQSEEGERNQQLFDLTFVSSTAIDRGTLLTHFMSDRKGLLKEIALARTSLHRTLSFMSGLDQLRPIDADMTCIQQASLDIRNSLALAADASSCLPRIWNAKDPLRDYYNE